MMYSRCLPPLMIVFLPAVIIAGWPQPALLTGAFFKPAPPRGLGLRCAQTDQYGYAQVTVTSATLTVQPRTASGGVVLDASGAPCAPLIVRAT